MRFVNGWYMFMIVGIEKECKVIKEFHWKKSLFALFGEKVSQSAIDVN